MKEIHLRNNKGIALVDDEDFERLNQYKWYLHTAGYARRRGTMINYKLSKATYLHQDVLGMPNSIIDHRNGDKLDCQKSNLRLATQGQNSANAKKTNTRTTSKYKGVHWNTRDKIWVSEIKIDKKKMYLGARHLEIEAAKLYNEAAIKYFGEFALLNKIEIIQFSNLKI